MASRTEICNIALSHLGVSKEISNIDTDNSQEANACRRFYNTARDATLGDFAWPFAKRFTELSLIEEDPNDYWSYSYRYPVDCLRVIRLISGVWYDDRQSRSNFEVMYDATGPIIFSSLEDATIIYTVKNNNPTWYPADFIMAFSWRLAAYVAPRMTGGDPFKMGERALKMYMLEISRAESNSLNEVQVPEDPNSEFIQARE